MRTFWQAEAWRRTVARWRLRVPLLGGLVSFAILSCGDGGDAASPGGSTAGSPQADWPAAPFVAFERDFASYLQWHGYFLGEGGTPDSVHPAGPRSVYINRFPPHGSTTFPVGTIIVKAIKNDPMSNWRVFAMVKRGADFNFLGARDWEWFELAETDAGATTIKWRGVEAPDGEDYGGLGGGACNVCHDAGKKNDFVLSPPLDLKRF